MNDESIEALITLIGIVLIIILTVPVIASYFESETFNRLCGGKTTLFNAMFVELRVDGTCTGGASKK